MLLKNLLATIPSTTKIKVGARSMFIYCGDNDNIAQRYLNDKDLLNRQVIDCFDSYAYFEPNTKVIQVEGEEIGRYWTMDEFAKKLAKIRKEIAQEQA